MRMTLDDTWKKCLSMWKWVAKEKRVDPSDNADDLKSRWLRSKGIEGVFETCFFCDHANRHKKDDDFDYHTCRLCPARKIEPDFTCCGSNNPHHYHTHSVKFYNKLVSLNRKRLKAKK